VFGVKARYETKRKASSNAINLQQATEELHKVRGLPVMHSTIRAMRLNEKAGSGMLRVTRGW